MEPTKDDDHSSCEDDEDEEKYDDFVTNNAIIDKYKAAATITKQAMEYVTKKIVPGTDIASLCIDSDLQIEKLCAPVYTGKKTKAVEKGLAFPTCISVNEVCGHYSPLKEDSKKLIVGDLVKIDLGCHIDGYVAQLSHTIVIGATKEQKATGKLADVVYCARKAFEAALSLVKKGNTNKQVTDAIKKVCEECKCNGVEGVLSHRVKRHLIDCNESIINKETFEQCVAEHKFDENEVFVIDVMVSTGEGKPKESEKRTTVFKRSLENTYILKTKTGRQFFSLVNKKFPTFPFSINGFDDLSAAKMGVVECVKHDLLTSYPVLEEKEKEFVAQFKATVLLSHSRAIILNEMPFETEFYTPTVMIADKDTLKLLETHAADITAPVKPQTKEEKEKKKKDKKHKKTKKDAKKEEKKDAKEEVKKEEAKKEETKKA